MPVSICLFYDATTLNEIDRISTLRFETARTSLQGSTHVVWLSDDEIVTAIGEHFYAFRSSRRSDEKPSA